MSQQIDSLLSKISDLEAELERAFEEKRKQFAYNIERRRIIFETELAKRHRLLKINLWKYMRGARFMVVVTAPMIYVLIIPLLLLDVMVTLYQASCFPVYGIEKARRQDFIVFDRRHLAYLNGLEKLNCTYCSYANGLLAYVHEIASRTEAYWCPIKHAKRVEGAHRLQTTFSEFGDAEEFRKRAN